MNTRTLKTVLLGSVLAFAFSVTANASGPAAMHNFVGGDTRATLVVALGSTTSAATAIDRDSVRAAIKANVRDIVQGINTQNAKQATVHDSPNIVVVESGQQNLAGAAADLAGFKQAFAAAPTWRVSLVDETVDVPRSADMAVYRSVYSEESMHDNLPFRHKINFISGWSLHDSGAWVMDWYVVSEMEKSHKK